MKESIIIKKLGPLVDVCINDIKPLTLIIGPSAAGKSTLMKTIILMRYIFKMYNIRSYLHNAGISKSPFKVRFDSLLHDGMEKMINDDTVIEYTVVINKHTYTVEYRDKKLYPLSDIPNMDLYFLKESFISETRNIIPIWASRGSSAKGVELGYFFHETFNDFNLATEKIGELNLDYVGMKMKVQKNGKNPKKFLITSKEGQEIPVELPYASSGIQTSTPLIAIIKYFAQDFSFKEAFRRSVLSYLYDTDNLSRFKPEIEQTDLQRLIQVHIEEPELSLDPNAQRLLINEMVDYAFHKKADDRSVNIMIATHSPYIANHLNVLLKAGYYDNGRKSYPYLSEDKVAAFSIVNGELTSLVATDNETGHKVINTIQLSDTMESIFSDYESISE